MAEMTLNLLDKRQLDFGKLVTGGAQTLTILERIDVSDFMWGTLELRIHQSDLTGGSIAFDLLGDGATAEDPGLAFATASPLIPTVGVQASTAFLSTGGPLPGELATLRVRATKSSGGALNATISASLVLREESFDPTDIPGCVLWLDMLEGTSYTVQGAPSVVTSIRNLVSGILWSETTNPPLFETNTMNGRPCMKGDGVARRLISTDATALNAFIGINRPQTIMVVTQPSATTNYLSSFGVGNSGVDANGTAFVGRRLTNGRMRIERTDDAGTNVAADRGVNSALTTQVVTYVMASSTASIYVNNDAAPDPSGATISTGQITPNRCALFCRPDTAPDTFSDDRIGAVVVFNSALSDANRQSVVNWLMSRWGIG